MSAVKDQGFALLRYIIHIHIPAFPIAVARVRRPELRERPVAVAPLHSERALVLAVSAEARQEGVYKGMPLSKAVQFCPNLNILPPDPELIDRAVRVLSNKVAYYTPLWEPTRPGHIFLDVTGTERLWGKAKDTAGRLRREIREQLCLPGVAGVAGNKLVSGIAAEVIAPDTRSSFGGVLDVDLGRESSFIAPLKVDFLPGIGPVRKRMLLEELNITRAGEIAALELYRLKLVFGREAYVMHQRSLGVDPTPVYPLRAEPKVTAEQTLSVDENDDRKLLGVLYGLVEQCGLELRQREMFCSRAGLLIRYTDQQELSGRLKLERPGFWDQELYEPLQELFLKLCQRRVRVRFLRVWFGDFCAPIAQLALFEQAPAERQAKRADLTRALERVRAKHGGEAVCYGRVLGG
jgi:DNA polymerase-4